MTTVVSVGNGLDLKQDYNQTQIRLTQSRPYGMSFVWISKEDAEVLIPLLQKFVETGEI